MEKILSLKPSFNKTLPILAAMCLCLYFSYHTYYGERSLMRMDELNVTLDSKGIEMQELALVRISLEKKVAMLRPSSLSKDMLEEQAQFMLGFSSPNDVFIIGN